jgi:hypothetical protein
MDTSKKNTTINATSIPSEEDSLTPSHSQCVYVHSDDSRCPNTSDDHGLCYWHDPNFKKVHLKDCRQQLEQQAKQGINLSGYSLQRSHLVNLNLVRHGQKKGYQLINIDLYHADLQKAHLFHANLSHSSLMKADLREANLHFTNLENVNLLGAKLDGAKIENIRWGKLLLQEQHAKEALRKGDRAKAADYYEQAEEICRHIRKVAENQGLFETAGTFFYKEMVMRRKQQPRLSFNRIMSKLVDVFCGYGERPIRVISLSVLLILVCGFLFSLLGINYAGNELRLSFSHSLLENISVLGSSLYFSVVTFTTLGYGDIVPLGFSRLLAAAEAFTGSFTLALFVVVFVKKMTR